MPLVADLAFENIRAKALSLGVWDFIKQGEGRSVTVEEDRIFVKFVFSIDQKLDHLWNEGLVTWGGPREPHETNLRRVFPELYLQNFRTFREKKRPSLQICLMDFEKWGRVGELDIDLSSPFLDVWGSIVHLMEILVPGKTDHRKVRRKLRRDPLVAQFLPEGEDRA